MYKVYYRCPILWVTDDLGRRPLPLLDEACSTAGGKWLLSGRNSLLEPTQFVVAVLGDTSVHEAIAQRVNGVIELGRTFDEAKAVLKAEDSAFADAILPQTFVEEL